MPGARKRILVPRLVLLILGIPSMEVGGEGCAVKSGQQGRGYCEAEGNGAVCSLGP